MVERRRRVFFVAAVAAIFLAVATFGSLSSRLIQNVPEPTKSVQGASDERLAINALGKLAVKGRAPKTGYSRQQFGGDWGIVGNCDMRNLILKRDLAKVRVDIENNCTVLSGLLNDPYTAKTIQFIRGQGTSNQVQIDHIVAVSDAWQKGAQQLTPETRYELYNDPLNLLAVSGQANITKSGADAASWLPSNKPYRCRYVARQIAVKLKYSLWVTLAEQAAIKRVLSTCPNQLLPTVH